MSMEERLSAISNECMDTIDKAREQFPGCGVIAVVCMAVQRAYDAGFLAAGGTISKPYERDGKWWIDHDAAPLTRVDATAPSPIQAERHSKDEEKWTCSGCGFRPAHCRCGRCKPASLPLEAAPTRAELAVDLTRDPDTSRKAAPPSALDVAARLRECVHDDLCEITSGMCGCYDRLRCEAAAALEREHARAERLTQDRDRLERTVCSIHDQRCALVAKVAALEARLALTTNQPGEAK